MSRRIEIELTSARPDGNWTWRAAGARQPKGVFQASLLYDGAKPGDVVRAEADFEIDGITILAISAPQVKKRSEPERIEVIGPVRSEVPGVTTQLVGKADRRPGEHARTRHRGDDAAVPRRTAGAGRGGDRPPSRERGGQRSGARAVPGSGNPDGPGGQPRRSEGEPGRRANTSERNARPAEDHRERRDRPPSGRMDSSQTSSRRGSAGEAANRRRAESEPSGARRINPAHTHRNAALAALSPEEQVVAQQVLRGGIPAVRTAIHLEMEKAAAEGRPAPNADALMGLAERLLPPLKAAEWRDRAEAAVKSLEEISLRDLRSVVAGADAARDDETRGLATTLREALERRLESQRQEWTDEIVSNLEEGRVVRALRVASRPPNPSCRLGADLSERMSAAAGAAMSPDTPPDRWLTLLEALVDSPVRRVVQPAGLPENPGSDLIRAARQQVGRIPALATMLGVTMPPPPGPIRRPAPRGRSEDPGRPPARPPTATEAPSATEPPVAPEAPPDPQAGAAPQTPVPPAPLAVGVKEPSGSAPPGTP
ncbi:MAG: hypothetical protein ACR2KC_02630 [Acidimicrobiales bacterium]